MGGQGSGRKPSEATILRRTTEQRTPIADTGSPLYLPNYSGVKGADEKLKAKGYTAGSVLFSDGVNIQEDNFNLFWDDSINQLEPNLIKITSAGSAASPALKLNDTNTGIYSGGSNIISFSTDGTNRMSIDATGNVGINTTTPNEPLEILNAVGARFALTDDGTVNRRSLVLQSPGTVDYSQITSYKYGAGTGVKELRFNGTDLVLKDDGNAYFTGLVGFKETTPTAGLDIRKVAAGGVDGGNIIMRLYDETGGAPANWNIQTRTAVNSDLTFTSVDSGLHVLHLRGNTGNVGIGVTDPHSKLEVAGAISSATATITASSDTTDVSGINTLFINITGDIVLGGLTGGVDGQVLNIIMLGNFVNHVTLEHAEGVSAQDFINHLAADENISHGGCIYVCNGSDWYDASHARHV